MTVLTIETNFFFRKLTNYESRVGIYFLNFLPDDVFILRIFDCEFCFSCSNIQNNISVCAVILLSLNFIYDLSYFSCFYLNNDQELIQETTTVLKTLDACTWVKFLNSFPYISK